ncbi:MAG: TPM domain-containing protein [Chitinophagaceae bacterium]|nr:TPM domain-containing protein [Chitinophagaceae bacterium]
MMSPGEAQQLEAKLEDYAKTSSTQITVVTIKNLGGYDVAQYATELGQRWGVGQKGKDNGVVILASKEDRKVNISSGYGLEGALTDIICGRIIRNEIVPQFKQGDFYGGFNKAADAIILATKGEYKAEVDYNHGKEKVPPLVTILFIIIIVIIVFAISKGGGGNNRGGGYMSGRGYGDIATGMLLGELLGGGRHRGGGFGGGFGGGRSGGGFGGFGGGGFGGGGASGSW